MERAEQHDPLAGVPELSTYHATSTEDKVAALKLVADSVAQQSQVAARVLVFHPVTLTLYAVLLAVLVRLLYHHSGDLPLVMTTAAGAGAAGLVSVRWLTSGYVALAEGITWAWLGDDDVLVTRFGDEIIGTLILDYEVAEKGDDAKHVKGLIRAWTVCLKYRGKGVGGALLQDAIKSAHERNCHDIVLADDNAYTTRVLPRPLNAVFDERDKRAHSMLKKRLAVQSEQIPKSSSLPVINRESSPTVR